MVEGEKHSGTCEVGEPGSLLKSLALVDGDQKPPWLHVFCVSNDTDICQFLQDEPEIHLWTNWEEAGG